MVVVGTAHVVVQPWPVIGQRIGDRAAAFKQFLDEAGRVRAGGQGPAACRFEAFGRVLARRSLYSNHSSLRVTCLCRRSSASTAAESGVGRLWSTSTSGNSAAFSAPSDKLLTVVASIPAAAARPRYRRTVDRASPAPAATALTFSPNSACNRRTSLTRRISDLGLGISPSLTKKRGG